MSTTPPFTSMSQLIEMIEKDFLEKCTSCGLCLTNCPVFSNPEFDLVQKGPDVVMGKIVDLIRGGPASSEAYLMTYGCSTGCTNICGNECPQGIDLLPVFIAASNRLQAVGKGLPTCSYTWMPGHRYMFGNVFGDLLMKKSEAPWLKEIPAQPEPVDVVLYISCVYHSFPHLALEAMDILSKMGINFVTLGDRDLCCGAAKLILGDMEGAQRASQNYISTMAKFRPKKVVSLCDGCALWANTFLSMCFQVPFESQDITGFLVDNVDKLPFTRQLNKVVTVHDSCGQRRTGLCDTPRKLLEAIPGITLVEMEHNKENNLCCGGVTDWNYPGTREDMRFARAEEAKAVGADVMTTICNGCQVVLCPLEDQYPFEVKHITSLVAEAMGIYHEDKLKEYLLTKDVNKVLTEARDCIEESDLSLGEFERVLPTFFDIFIAQRKCPPTK